MDYIFFFSNEAPVISVAMVVPCLDLCLISSACSRRRIRRVLFGVSLSVGQSPSAAMLLAFRLEKKSDLAIHVTLGTHVEIGADFLSRWMLISERPSRLEDSTTVQWSCKTH